MKISMIIPGQPVAKGRARITTVGGFARAYTPAKTRSYENIVRNHAQEIMALRGLEPLEGPVALVLEAHLQIPASWSKKKTAEAIAGSIVPTSRPDLDNYIKAALDGLNEVVFKDDSQVVEISAKKVYSETPQLFVSIVKLPTST